MRANPRPTPRPYLAAGLVAGLLLGSCSSLSDRPPELRRADGSAVDLERQADELVGADVVFLGEEHDSQAVHDLQLALTRALSERRPVAVSMEMFERDAQDALNLYLVGAIDEAAFLERSHPWPDYAEHYRPVIELCRAHGLPVIAANAYRPLASRVAREGLPAVQGDAWAARNVHSGPSAYRTRFLEIMAHMAGHGQGMPPEAVQQMYEAQVLKDEAMAESIAAFLAGVEGPAPLVVHWCGRYHSDFGQGTVERLHRRRPDLDLRVVSGKRGSDEDDALRADYLWYVTD